MTALVSVYLYSSIELQFYPKTNKCSLIYKDSAFSYKYTAIRLYSISQTWIALNIVEQPCVGTIELLNEMKE